MKPEPQIPEIKFLNKAFANPYRVTVQAIYSRLLPRMTTNDLVALLSDLTSMPGDLYNDIAFDMITTEIKNREDKK